MADEEREEKADERALRDQLNDKLIDVRNEAIVQAANLYLFGRKALLASLGLGVLSIEAVQNLLERAVERGELAESDAQAMLKRMQQHGAEEVKERDEALTNMADKASVALSDSANTIMNVLGRTPKTPAAPETGTTHVGNHEASDYVDASSVDNGDIDEDDDGAVIGD